MYPTHKAKFSFFEDICAPLFVVCALVYSGVTLARLLGYL